MKNLNAFDYDEDEEKKSVKNLFDLMNEEVDEQQEEKRFDDNLTALGVFGDIEEKKDNTLIESEPPKKVVGSFDEDLFTPTEDSIDSVTRTVLTGQVDYSTIKDKLEKEKQEKARKEEESRKSKIETDLALPKEILEQKPQKRVKRVSSRIEGIASNHLNFIGNNRNTMIKSKPNEIIIPNLKNVYAVDNYKIEGSIGDDYVLLELLGFTSKFEAVFKLESNTTINTGGTSRIICEGISQYLINEVYTFELGDNLNLKVNDSKFIISFIETNKRNKSIRILPYFELDNINIQQLA